METWNNISIEGFEGLYQASTLGRIKSMPRASNRFGKTILLKEKILSPSVCKRTGYRNFTLINLAGKRKQVTVHRCIALAHCTGRTADRNVVNHLDSNRLNNEASNLEWCTQLENMQHASKAKRFKGISGSENLQSKLSEDQVLEIKDRYVKYDEKGNSGRDLAKEFKVSNVTIHNIVNNKKWKDCL